MARDLPTLDDLIALLDRLDDEGPSVVSSVREPAAMKEALGVAVELGLDKTVNDVMVRAVRDRLELFAQRLSLDAHYADHPDVRPSLAEMAQAAADLDGDPLAADPALLHRAAKELVSVKPAATADDVLLYAAGLRSRASA